MEMRILKGRCKKEEQLKKQQEMEEKRKVLLQSLLTNEARERCNNNININKI